MTLHKWDIAACLGMEKRLPFIHFMNSKSVEELDTFVASLQHTAAEA